MLHAIIALSVPIYRLVLVNLLSNTTQAISTVQAAVGASSSIATYQIDKPHAVAGLGTMIYFSTRTGPSSYALMKLRGKCYQDARQYFRYSVMQP